MATTRGQRLAIWIITGVMIAGTIGGFVAMMVAPANEAKDQAEFEAAYNKWMKEQEEYNNKVAKQDEEYRKKLDKEAEKLKLNKKYYSQFKKYESRVSQFDGDKIDELKTKDLKKGKGKDLEGGSKVAVYYIGWNPSGEIFDQSIDGKKLKTPFQLDTIESEQIIDGWKEGLVGMKVGGVREISIPAELAYGEMGSGDKIPANTPIRFVVMAIPALDVKKPEAISPPEVPEILTRG